VGGGGLREAQKIRGLSGDTKSEQKTKENKPSRGVVLIIGRDGRFDGGRLSCSAQVMGGRLT